MATQSLVPETVRLGNDTKTHLSTLKRRTGIENWNTLCRWAFCLSLADPAPVRELVEHGLGAVEMTWRTFTGDEEPIYRALLIDRSEREHGSLDRDKVAITLRQHIARGTARLVSRRDWKGIGEFLRLVETEGRAVGSS